MVKVNFTEVINLEHFSQISTISNFQFQVLPHGQHIISFSQKNQPKIQFLVKELENNPWKLEEYEFINPLDQISKSPDFCIQFTNQIDNQGHFIILYSLIHSNTLSDTKSNDISDSISDTVDAPLYYTSSHNYGKSWEKPIQISPEGENWVPSGNVVMLEVGYHIGSFLIPVYNPIGKRLLCITSNDNGKLWNFSLYVEPSEENLNDLGEIDELEKSNEKIDEIASVGTKDGHVCELNDGKLFLFCRVHTSNKIHIAISKDVGATWTETKPIENFPGMDVGAFDCLNLLDLENSTDNMFFLGNQQVQNQFRLVLWKYDSVKNQIVEMWAHSDLFHDPITQLHLFKEDNHIFHITFLSPEQKLYHYEISKT